MLGDKIFPGEHVLKDVSPYQYVVRSAGIGFHEYIVMSSSSLSAHLSSNLAYLPVQLVQSVKD